VKGAAREIVVGAARPALSSASSASSLARCLALGGMIVAGVENSAERRPERCAKLKLHSSQGTTTFESIGSTND
jgi:hypothetical protein